MASVSVSLLYRITKNALAGKLVKGVFVTPDIKQSIPPNKKSGLDFKASCATMFPVLKSSSTIIIILNIQVLYVIVELLNRFINFLCT